MIIVVSNKGLSLGSNGDVLLVESLLDASKFMGNISYLVYHSINESTN